MGWGSTQAGDGTEKCSDPASQANMILSAKLVGQF